MVFEDLYLVLLRPRSRVAKESVERDIPLTKLDGSETMLRLTLLGRLEDLPEALARRFFED